MTTGNYTGLDDFAAGEGVRVSYEKNTAPGVFTLWGSSPNTTISTTLTVPPPGLGAGRVHHARAMGVRAGGAGHAGICATAAGGAGDEIPTTAAAQSPSVTRSRIVQR